MTEPIKARYDIYVNTISLGVMKAAEAILLEEGGLLTRFGFRYTENYIDQPLAFALDPVQLPLTRSEFLFACRNGIPGILDDYLPDDWGRKVLARLALYRHQKKINRHSCVDTLSELGNSRIGALQWVSDGKAPQYESGAALSHLSEAELAAQLIDKPEGYPEQLDELSLLYLANAGTGVGGARPKALLYEGAEHYLAKFNRLSQDPYNNARVELACLKLAELAGLEVFSGRVREGVNGREVLLLNRFDIITKGRCHYRKHLITANAMLKEPSSQRDHSGVFRYDDIVTLIRRYSFDVEKDLTQLLRMMLFNRAINNTDNHERNFSFMHTENGYRLAPAYDMVPTLSTGEYPAAGYHYSPQPPLPSEAKTMGKVFGLPKTQVRKIAEEVENAVQQWSVIAAQTGVECSDIAAVAKVIKW